MPLPLVLRENTISGPLRQTQRSSKETCFSEPSILKEDRPVPSRKLDLILTSPSFDLPPIFVGESHLSALRIVFVLYPLATVFLSTG